MNDNQRLQLQNMIQRNNVEDQTELIRNLKHSEILRNELNVMMEIKTKYRENMNAEEVTKQIYEECVEKCSFLFTYYTDIYNKIRKDEIDLKILFKALDVLRDIEDGKIDQHDGAYKFGLLLKQIYVDSALKKAEKLNAEDTESEYKGPQVEISWNQFKKMNCKR